MNDSTNITLIVTRACVIDGRRAEPGTKFSMAAADALDAIEGGRIDFVDPADRERCLEARRRRVAVLLRKPRDLDGPWHQIFR